MYIVTAQEMYEIERRAMQELGISSLVLMENAGRAIAKEIINRIDAHAVVAVVIGPGNNGGDGFVIARTLLQAGFTVQAVQVVSDEKIRGDAQQNKQMFEASGGSCTMALDVQTFITQIQSADLLVDALLGIGIRGKVKEPFTNYIAAMNACPAQIVSVDIPSGLPAGELDCKPNAVVQADQTYMLGACKMSAFLPDTASFYGDWKLLEIGLPKDAFKGFDNRQLTQCSQVQCTLPQRDLFSHKGSHGKSLIVGGSRLMPGSIALTAKTALRAGVGLAAVGTVREAIPVVAAHCLEATYVEFGGTAGYIEPLTDLDLSGYDGIAMGPGMGKEALTGDCVRDLFRRATCPIVLDADGLYHAKQLLPEAKNRDAATLITPHPGELAMLLDMSIPELLVKPFSLTSQFAKETGTYVLLKGKYTIVTAPDGRQSVNTTGNPGLAKGGSGDCLTGIVLALAMQQDDPFLALRNACYLHGLAADLLIASQHTTRDLLASDLADGLSAAFRTLM